MTDLMVSSNGKPVPPPPRVTRPYDPIARLSQAFGTDRDTSLKLVTTQYEGIKGMYPANPAPKPAPKVNAPARELGPILHGGSCSNGGKRGGYNY